MLDNGERGHRTILQKPTGRFYSQGIIAPRTPRHGFKLNAARDAYEVDEVEMDVVRLIFRLVGAEGRTPGSLAKVLEQQGVLTPKGTKRWDRTFFRTCILDDIYKPYSFEEMRPALSAQAAPRLDPDKRYGLWWYNRRAVKTGQVAEPGPNGRRYRKTYHWHQKPKEAWIAVPVPDSGIPRELVEAARAVVKSNRKPARAGRRVWELTGRTAYCGRCGHTMCATRSTKTKKGHLYSYDYYSQQQVRPGRLCQLLCAASLRAGSSSVGSRLRSFEGPLSLASRTRKAHRKGAPVCARKPRQRGRDMGEAACRDEPQAQRLPGPAGRGAYHPG